MVVAVVAIVDVKVAEQCLESSGQSRSARPRRGDAEPSSTAGALGEISTKGATGNMAEGTDIGSRKGLGGISFKGACINKLVIFGTSST
jgi:hypothetical protein